MCWEGDRCLSGSIYRVRATKRLNRGGALRWRETRVIPGRLPGQEEPPLPFLDSQFAPCKVPRPHILPPVHLLSVTICRRVSVPVRRKVHNNLQSLEMFELANGNRVLTEYFKYSWLTKFRFFTGCVFSCEQTVRYNMKVPCRGSPRA